MIWERTEEKKRSEKVRQLEALNSTTLDGSRFLLSQRIHRLLSAPLPMVPSPASPLRAGALAALGHIFAIYQIDIISYERSRC